MISFYEHHPSRIKLEKALCFLSCCALEIRLSPLIYHRHFLGKIFLGVRNSQEYFTSDQKCTGINSLLKAIYIMKYTWISRPQSHLNFGWNLALFPDYTGDSETQTTLKKCLFKKKINPLHAMLLIIIKSWCSILKARCILLSNCPTEVIPWEFS